MAVSRSVQDSLMEVMFLVSALRRSSAKRITAVLPYIAYARQTQIFDPNRPRPIAASDIALMLLAMGVDAVILMDVHNPRLEGFFPATVPCLTIDSQALAVHYFITTKDLHRPVVVATDQGGGERAMSFLNRMKAAGVESVGMASMVSNRRHKSSHYTAATTQGGPTDEAYCTTPQGDKKFRSLEPKDWLVGDVRGRDCVIVDDIIDSGARMERAAHVLKNAGARHIYMFATHGLFSKGAITRLENSPLREVVVTNSVTQPLNLMSRKLVIISAGGLVAETVRRLHAGESLRNLFKPASLFRLSPFAPRGRRDT
eukprot:Filipodium_phascolosomae@DN4741_c0_g1_i1.p1